jgi:hypothetical protein
MSSSAWFWLLFIIVVYWIAPLALFFFRGDESGDGLGEWTPMAFGNLGFSRKWETVVVLGVCAGTSWIIWLFVKLGWL